MKTNQDRIAPALKEVLSEEALNSLNQLELPHNRHEAYTYVNTRLLGLDQVESFTGNKGALELDRDSDALAQLSILLNPKAQEIDFSKKEILLSSTSQGAFESYHFKGKVKGAQTLNLKTDFQNHSLRSVVLHIEIPKDTSLKMNVFSKGSEEGIETIKIRADLGENAEFKLVTATGGSKLTRCQTEIHLNGENANTEIHGVAVLNGSKQAHHHLDLHHHALATESKQRFHNVVLDQSQLSIDGTVIVDQAAQKTDSDQLIKALMLSEDAKVAGKPNLQIYADDVACAHGYTCGELEPAQIFYLESRGLTKDQAKRILTRSFVEAPIFECSDKELAKEIDLFFLNRLPEKLS